MKAQQLIETAVLAAACCAIMTGGLACAAPPAKACPVTSPNGSTPPGEKPAGHHGNGALWTVLSTDGKVIIRPGVSGSIQPDGSLAMKFPWWRGVRGRLAIQGRRLDAKAPPLRASIPEGYGDTGFQAPGLIVPAENCWEVTGKAGEASLTFVTEVIRAEEQR
jgi:hypothetical protein